MARGKAPTQVQFEDAARLLGDRLAEGSLYRLLAVEGQRLFGDDYFADCFTDSRRGRPTIPARTIATVMLLQSFEGLSDQEATDRLAFDLRWQAAAGLTAACGSFHPTVLVGMRNRLRRSVRPRRLFEDTVSIAKRAGVVSRKVRVLDSTPLLDAVATQDTVTQLRASIRSLLRIAPAALAQSIREALRWINGFLPPDHQMKKKPAPYHNVLVIARHATEEERADRARPRRRPASASAYKGCGRFGRRSATARSTGRPARS